MDEWGLEPSGPGPVGLNGIWSFLSLLGITCWIFVIRVTNSFCAHNGMLGITLDLALRGSSAQYTYTWSLKTYQYRRSLDFQFNIRLRYFAIAL